MCDGNCLECVFDDCIATEKEIMALEKAEHPVTPKEEAEREKKRAYSRAYYYAHKEHIQETHKILYEQKKDYIRKVNNERYKEYYKENREEILQKKKKAREMKKNGRKTNVCKDNH
jgi:hypothetical protein